MATTQPYGRINNWNPIHRAQPALTRAEREAEVILQQVERDANEMTPQQRIATYGDYTVVQQPPASVWSGNIDHAKECWEDSYVPIHHLHQLQSLIGCVAFALAALPALICTAGYNYRWAMWATDEQRALRERAVENLSYASLYIACGIVCAVKHCVLTVCIDPITFISRCAYPVKHLLIIVDPQLDFLPPLTETIGGVELEYEGRLAVEDGWRIFGEPTTTPWVFRNGINDFARRFNGAVVASKDEHPIKGKPHGATGAMMGVEQFARGTLNGVRDVMGWIFHCCTGTRGNKFAWRLDQSRIEWVVKKGTQYTSESFGAFANADGKKTLLEKYIKAIGAKHVHLVGLAYDYCVGETAVQAFNLGLNVHVYKSLTASVKTPIEHLTAETQAQYPNAQDSAEVMDARLAALTPPQGGTATMTVHQDHMPFLDAGTTNEAFRVGGHRPYFS